MGRQCSGRSTTLDPRSTRGRLDVGATGSRFGSIRADSGLTRGRPGVDPQSHSIRGRSGSDPDRHGSTSGRPAASNRSWIDSGYIQDRPGVDAVPTRGRPEVDLDRPAGRPGIDHGFPVLTRSSSGWNGYRARIDPEFDSGSLRDRSTRSRCGIDPDSMRDPLWFDSGSPGVRSGSTRHRCGFTRDRPGVEPGGSGMDPQSVLDPISIRCRSESVPIDLGSIRGQSGIGQGSAWGRPAVGGQAGRDRRSTRCRPGANPMSAPAPTQCQPGVDQESIRERLRVDLRSTPGLLSIEVDPGSIQRRSVVGGRSGVDQGPIRDRPGDRVVRTDPECIRVDPGRPRIGAGSTRGLPAVAARSTSIRLDPQESIRNLRSVRDRS